MVNNSGEYQKLTFENTLLTALPGQPALPYRQVKLMLPPGEAATGIEVSFENEIILPGWFKLFPQQEVRPVSSGASGVFFKNNSIYNSNTSYPADPQGHLVTAFLNGRAFALSTFTPVRYNPVTGKVSYYASARVVVKTATDSKAINALKNLSADRTLAEKFADNPQMALTYSTPKAPLTGNYELLIICTAAFSGNFVDLQSGYLKQGLRSQIATLESISSSMTGIDVPEKIRNYIIQEYQAHGIQHVLLAGDVELIPFRGFYCYVQSGSGYTDSNIPADIYYSSLDGNWNTDGDALWAEPGEDDLLPDISVGRLTFSNSTELGHILNKSSGYQYTPVAGEFRNVLLAGEYLYGAPYLTWGSYYLELLIGEHSDNGYYTKGMPSTFPIDKLYDETATWSKQDLMNHLNMGRPMLHHVGHANQTYVMKLSPTDITNANFIGLNGVTHNFTIIYTHGCFPGAFDYNDCIAEKMVTIDNFAAAFVGNSRYGWFNEGTNEGPSAHLHREFADALYSDSLNRIGRAHMESKIATMPWVTAPGQWEPGALRWCFYDCNVLGDPAMAIYSDNPINIHTNFPANISSGTASVTVTVTSEGLPKEGLCCVVIENGVLLGKATTDPNGNAVVQLDPAIQVPANVQLTVSGYNCIPTTYNLIAKTYTWNVASGNWKTASSWLPSRTQTAANDVLIFNGSIRSTPSVTLDFVSTQPLGKLKIYNNASVSFTTASTTKTLNIGSTDIPSPQFEVASGSSLTVGSANTISFNVLSGYKGSVSGNITFQQAAHRLTATDTNGITFNNGAVFTAGTNFTGNAFETVSLNSILFSGGSTYQHQAGSSPFGTGSPNSVVVFHPGSLYKFTAASGAPELSGRTYSNMEINSSSSGLNQMTGSGSFSADNLTITSGTCGYNLTGGIHIRGNISVVPGATLNFDPAISGTVYFDGAAAQAISGGGTIWCGANSTIQTINPAGVTLNTNATFNDVIIGAGILNVPPGIILITNGVHLLEGK